MDSYAVYNRAKQNIPRLNRNSLVLFHMLTMLVEPEFDAKVAAQLLNETALTVRSELQHLIEAGILGQTPAGNYHLRPMMKHLSKELMEMETIEAQAAMRQRVINMYAHKLGTAYTITKETNFSVRDGALMAPRNFFDTKTFGESRV